MTLAIGRRVLVPQDIPVDAGQRAVAEAARKRACLGCSSYQKDRERCGAVWGPCERSARRIQPWARMENCPIGKWES